LFLSRQVRMRDTFMKVAHSLMVKKQLVNEKGLKEKMIHSVMPPKVSKANDGEQTNEGGRGRPFRRGTRRPHCSGESADSLEVQ